MVLVVFKWFRCILGVVWGVPTDPEKVNRMPISWDRAQYQIGQIITGNYASSQRHKIY